MRRFAVAALTAVMLVPLVSACAPTPTASPQSESPRADDIVGTWTVDGAFDTPEHPFVAFADDGRWTASDGCNRVNGTWDLSPSGVLTTTAGPHTLMWCDGVQLPVAVALADSASVEGDTLTVTSSQDATVTELVRTDDSDIGLQGVPIGYWVATPGVAAPFLSISADGTYTGNDGCNVINGTWEASPDGTISLTPGATTLMACPDTDNWLNAAGSVSLRNGTLTVQDAQGEVLGQLTSPPDT